MKFVTILFQLIFICSIAAKDNKSLFVNISTFSGLSSSRAKCISQDSDGYLWIGTMNGGLNRYDGYSFKVYKNIAEDSTSIIHNNVYGFSEDKSNNIWLATSDGISVYQKDTDNFINYRFREIFKELSNIDYHSVYEVFIDSKDRVWVGDSFLGVSQYNKKDDSFIPITQKSGDSVYKLPQVCGDITEDKNGVIWASIGPSGGLFWYDEYEHIFRQADMNENDKNLLKSQDVFRVYADSESNIWVMTTTDLYKYVTSSQKLVHLLNYKVPNPINGGYEGELFEDDEGTMWVVNISMRNPIVFKNRSLDYEIINTVDIYASDIFIDSFGIVWISDWSSGLYKYVPTKQTFNQIESKSEGEIYWENFNVQQISQSLNNPNVIYIKSRFFGNTFFDSYNLKTGQIKEYNAPGHMTFLDNNDGTFWLGIWDGGLKKWNSENGEVISYFSDSSKTPNLEGTTIPSIHKNPDGNLWIGTLNGLYFMNLEEESLELVIPEHSVTKIYSDSEVLWLGTYGSGLIKFDLISQNFKIFHHDKESNSISNNIVWDIYRDNEGYLWLATEGGLNRLDLRNNKFEVFQQSDGLNNDYIAALLPDEYGRLWLSTITGISLMYKDSQNRISFSNYDASDGLMNPDFRHSAKFIDNFGQLYFGGRNGLYYFTPQKKKSTPPRTYVTDIVVNGKSVVHTLEGFSNQIGNRDLQLDLSHNENTLSIDFVALHYANPTKNRYSYYLEGKETKWQISNKRNVQYLNLEPGSYKFHLQAANRYGLWNDQEIIIPINISFPWWDTWYAYLLYFGLIVVGLSGMRQFELNRRKEIENKKLLEAENRRKSQELEEARKLQLSMLPRDIPKLPNIDIAVYMKTATEVGGDYYDFHVSLDGTFTAVIGDATGHGMKAGTMVTSSKSLFSSYAENDNIINTFHEMTRCIKNMHIDNLSMCMTMIKLNGNKIRMSAAGMPPVYIYRKKTSSVEEYLFQGMPLGTMKEFPYEVRETSLSSGDVIILMSDGFPELTNESHEMLGFKRTKHLLEEVAEESPEEIISKLKNAGSDWVNDADPDDDVTFVVIKVK